MELHNLTKLAGTKKRKRVGRGNGSGIGTFCRRGMKGMGQRKSGNVRPGFEGGQTPLIKRLPKLKGFKNATKVYYQPVNLQDLERLTGETVSMETLLESKIIRKKDMPVKILSAGDVNKKYNFEGKFSFSKLAKEKILKAGGKIN